MKVNDYLAKCRASVEWRAGTVRAVDDWPWIVVMTALLLLVPWMLFVSDIVFSPSCPAEHPLALYVAYLVASVVSHVVLFRDGVERRLPYGSACVLGSLLFSAGIVLVYVGSLGNWLLACQACQVAGVVACAAGGTMLVSRWYRHYSRIPSSVTCVLVCCSILLCVAFYLALHLISQDFRTLSAAVFFAALSLVCSRKVRECPSAAAGNWAVEAIVDSEIYSQQKKSRIYVLLALVCVTFGYFVAGNLDDRARGLGIEPTGYMVGGLVAFVAVAALALYVVVSDRNGVLEALNAMVAFALIGLLAYMSPELSQFGRALVFVGFVLANLFHLVFYSGLCQLRRFAPVGAAFVLKKTRVTIPFALLAGVLLYQGSLYAPQGVGAVVTLVLEAAILLVYMLMASSEISDTRKELLCKSATAVSLEDVKRFAAAHADEYHLTPRECELVHLFMSGRSVEHAARELGISKSTVKTHVASVYKKFGVGSRQEMIDIVGRGVRH